MEKTHRAAIYASSLFLVFALLLCMGCTSKEEKIAAFAGTWVLSAVSAESQEVPSDVMDQLNKSGLNYQLILKNDTPGSLDLAGTQSSFKWEVSSDTKATLKFDEGQTIEITRDGDNITMVDSGLKMTFAKKTS